MANYLWRVTAKRNFHNEKILKGMSVEIIVKNASRKPMQQEIASALNEKYGSGTASNGISTSDFDMVMIS